MAALQLDPRRSVAVDDVVRELSKLQLIRLTT
jgi:hypothetical protein